MANPTLVHAATSTTLTFLRLAGEPLPLGQTVEDITRQGVDGAAFRTTGTRSRPQEWRSLVDCADAATVKTTYASYRGLIGKLVTRTDELGNAWTNVAVLDVRMVRQHKVSTFVGGINTPSAYILECAWVLQDTE